MLLVLIFFFSSRRRHTRWPRDWSSDVCSSDLLLAEALRADPVQGATATVEQLAVRDGAGGVVGHGLADGQGVARGQVGAEDVPAQVGPGVDQLPDLDAGLHSVIGAARHGHAGVAHAVPQAHAASSMLVLV